MGNFFECIKTREQPISDVFSHHRAISTCHLANICIRLDRPIKSERWLASHGSCHHGSDAPEKLAILLADQQHRWKTDIPLKVDYLSKLPELANDPGCKLELAVGEFQARQDGD